MNSLFRSVLLFTTFWSGAIAAEHFPEPGRYAATCYTVGASKRAEVIAGKMSQAVAKNREWLDAYLKELNLKPGEILPYHENLGVTREEYGFFLTDAKKMSLVKFSDAVVNVSSDKGGPKISIENLNLPVSKFEFSPDGTRMKCAYGTTNEHDDINQTDSDSPIGRWTGLEWRIQEGNADLVALTDYLSFRFAIGRDEVGRNVIYIRSSGLKSKVPNNWGCIIRWPAE
jgi:hypothetical protein